MASQGPNSAATGANDSAVGTRPWTNTGNIVSSNNSRCFVGSTGPTSFSNYLKATNFMFSIPSGATIDGIVVEIERSQSNGVPNTVKDVNVKIIKGGTIQTTNNADTTTTWPVTASEAYKTYGSSTDLWGTTWTDTDINAATFGVAISVIMDIGKVAINAQVDHVRITVYYTTGGGGGSTASSLLLAGD